MSSDPEYRPLSMSDKVYIIRSMNKKSFRLVITLIAFGAVWVSTEVARAGSAHLTWNANAESDLSGYKIYYATSSHAGTCPTGYTSSQDAGNVTSYWFDNLTAGQTYYFQITAKDTSNNESGCSTSPGEVSKLVTYRGDLNVDHAVNVLDFGILHTNYGNTTAGNVANINRDSSVNVLDFGILKTEYGSSF